MPDHPPNHPVPIPITKCPKCNYDLRSHLGPPVPAMVTCPECGLVTPSVNVIHPEPKRISLRSLLTWMLLPLPAASVLFIVEPVLLYIALIFWPLTLACIIFHCAVVAGTASLRSGPSSRSSRGELAFLFFSLALIWDAVVVGTTIYFMQDSLWD